MPGRLGKDSSPLLTPAMAINPPGQRVARLKSHENRKTSSKFPLDSTFFCNFGEVFSFYRTRGPTNRVRVYFIKPTTWRCIHIKLSSSTLFVQLCSEWDAINSTRPIALGLLL